MPGVRGKVVPPELPEEGVVLILWPPRLVVVGVVAPKHVEVGVVGHAAVAAPGRGAPVACMRRRRRRSSTDPTSPEPLKGGSSSEGWAAASQKWLRNSCETAQVLRFKAQV